VSIRCVFCIVFGMSSFICGRWGCLRISVAISERVEEVLWALCNSTLKHVGYGDVKVLLWRVDWTLEQLKKISCVLFLVGFDSVGRFICNAVNYIVTFVRLVIKGVSGVSFCSDLVERLVGEIAKRVKHEWMYWSECGLENLLNIFLIRIVINGFMVS